MDAGRTLVKTPIFYTIIYSRVTGEFAHVLALSPSLQIDIFPSSTASLAQGTQKRMISLEKNPIADRVDFIIYELSFYHHAFICAAYC